MASEFISPQDRRWKEALDRIRHDFYHLPEYVSLCAELEQASPAAFYAERDGACFLAPLLIRKIPANLGAPEGWFDCVSPYGYSTPLIGPPHASLPYFLEAFRDAACRHRIVTALFRLHPLLALNHEALGKFGHVVQHGQTVWIDLAHSREEMWSHTSLNHRRNIKKLINSGFTVSIDDWSRYGAFIAIYRRTMERVGARQDYFFSDEYFEGLKEALADRLHLCCVLSKSGEPASAGLFVETHGLVQYHLGGTADDHLSIAPSKLMFDSMRSWAKERSNTAFHLGGGVGGVRDSLFEFKAGFSKERSGFFTYRMVLDEEKHQALLRLAKTNDHRNLEACSSFFPAYRLTR